MTRRRALLNALASPLAFLGVRPGNAVSKGPGPASFAGNDAAKVPGSFDAHDWAKAFVAIAKASPTTVRLNCGAGELYIPLPDEEWMTTWFANALMRGYDEHRWELERDSNDTVTYLRNWVTHERERCDRLIDRNTDLLAENALLHGYRDAVEASLV